MDILNFISWIKGGRLVNTVDPTQSLLPIAVKDVKRDDGWLAVAMTVEDFTNQLDLDRLTAGTSEFVLDSTGTLTLNTGDLTIKTDPLLGDDIFILATDRAEVRGGDKLLNTNSTGGHARLIAGDGSYSDGITDAGDGGSVRVYAGDAGTSVAGNQATGGNVNIRGGYTTLAATKGGDVYIAGGFSANNIEGTVFIGNINNFTFDPNFKTLTFPIAVLSDLGSAVGIAGARAVINDSSTAATGNFGAIVAGGGADVVPVFSDGTNWLIG